MSDSTNNNKDPGSKTPESAPAADPFEAWRKLRDSSLDIWSKGMIQTVNSEAYAKMMGATLDMPRASTQSASQRDR